MDRELRREGEREGEGEGEGERERERERERDGGRTASAKCRATAFSDPAATVRLRDPHKGCESGYETHM